MKRAEKLLQDFKDHKGYGEMRCAWSDEGVIELLEFSFIIKSFCDCGKPIDSRYAPCCSMKCWDKKFL